MNETHSRVGEQVSFIRIILLFLQRPMIWCQVDEYSRPIPDGHPGHSYAGESRLRVCVQNGILIYALCSVLCALCSVLCALCSTFCVLCSRCPSYSSTKCGAFAPHASNPHCDFRLTGRCPSCLPSANRFPPFVPVICPSAKLWSSPSRGS